MSLKVESFYLILAVRSNLKKPILIFQAQKNHMLQILTPLLVRDHDELLGSLHIILLMMKSGLIAYALAVAQEIPEGVDPSTYSEAISCAKSSNWLMEIQEEMESLYKNETWQLCELSKGLHALIAK